MTTAHTTLNKIQKGFTLIELLIVIAILGVLAAAVLSAINPLEQINRGRDTGSLSDAEQLHGAISRYDAAQGLLPWQIASTDTTAQAWTKVADTWVASDASTQILTLLGPTATGGTGELLPAYLNRIKSTGYNPLYIYNGGGAGDSTYVCYQSKSGSIAKKAKDRCGASGAGLPVDLQAAQANICNVTVAGVAAQYFTCLP